jgi:hypothetical protein
MTFIVQLGPLREHDVVDRAALRMTKGYPVYGCGYQEGLA